MTASVPDALSAASYMAKVSVDNGLCNHIQTALRECLSYKRWQSAMPSTTPVEISRYQKDYETSNYSAVSEEIDQVGSYLSSGQQLFHGGLWSGAGSLTTKRPLSTSLCPQVALRNAEYNAKAYDAGRIDLFVLRIVNPTTKAFVFKRRGTKLGHESEVLISSGALLTLKTQTWIRSNYLAAKCDQSNKEIPIYVLEIEVS